MVHLVVSPAQLVHWAVSLTINVGGRIWGKVKQSRVEVIANPIMQKLYSAASAPGGFSGIGGGECSSVEKVN